MPDHTLTRTTLALPEVIETIKINYDNNPSETVIEAVTYFMYGMAIPGLIIAAILLFFVVVKVIIDAIKGPVSPEEAERIDRELEDELQAMLQEMDGLRSPTNTTAPLHHSAVVKQTLSELTRHHNRAQGVLRDYADMLFDPEVIITRPLIRELTQPLTMAMERDVHELRGLLDDPAHTFTPLADNIATDADLAQLKTTTATLGEVATRARDSFDKANVYAMDKGIPNVSANQQQRAHELLKQVLSENLEEEVRNTAWSLLLGIIRQSQKRPGGVTETTIDTLQHHVMELSPGLSNALALTAPTNPAHEADPVPRPVQKERG